MNTVLPQICHITAGGQQVTVGTYATATNWPASPPRLPPPWARTGGRLTMGRQGTESVPARPRPLSDLAFPQAPGHAQPHHDRVGSRELAAARQDPRFSRWEIGLPQAAPFHELVARSFARRGFVTGADNQVVLEAAKAFIIRERSGRWAIKFLDDGILYFSSLEVQHSVDNFVRSREGNSYLQNVPLESFAEDTLPRHPSSETITGRPAVPPDLQLLPKEFHQVVAENRAGLTSREQELFDLLRTYAPYSDERGAALRRFSQAHDISTDPGSVHRWIRKLQQKLLHDARLWEILSDYLWVQAARLHRHLPLSRLDTGNRGCCLA